MSSTESDLHMLVELAALLLVSDFKLPKNTLNTSYNTITCLAKETL